MTDVDETDLPDLYRCASLRQAGIGLAAGTDAPFGDADPWRSIHAAITRRTTDGRMLGADERVSPTDALTLFLGRSDDPARSRQIRAGEPADLCVLAEPLATSLATCTADPSAVEVRATIAAGDVVYLRD
jgi:predicted amidohydrolase YtcJ